MDLNFYKPRKVLSIEKNDIKVALIGKIVEIKENYFLLEDETGNIKINHNLQQLKNYSLVRVFCTKIDEELFCDFIQNLEGLDKRLFDKVEDLYLKLL